MSNKEALQRAIQHDDAKQLETLLQTVDKADLKSSQAVGLCVLQRNEKCLQLILDKHGMSCLDKQCKEYIVPMAVKINYFPCLKMLLEYSEKQGPEPGKHFLKLDIANQNGKTALYLAIDKQNYRMARYRTQRNPTRIYKVQIILNVM